MMEMDIDTNKIRLTGNDIIRLSGEIKEILVNLFDMIQKLPTINGGWTGLSADKFIYDALVDKGEYIALKHGIYNLGKYLNDYANELEAKINEVKQ